MRFFKKIKYDLIFLIILMIISFFYGYHRIIFHRPYSVHQWRQADGLSITLNYYKENRNFFKPAIHWSGDDGGMTVSEFPVIYFLVAQLWKIFGCHEFIFRFIDLLIFFAGLFCLFRFLKEFLSDNFWAAAIPVLIFSSPAIAFYANNFIPDVPAFGFALAGGYFFWKYTSQKKQKWLFFSLLVFLAGGLIKISSLLIFIAIIIALVFNIVLKKDKKILNILKLWPYCVVIFLICCWNYYSFVYNKHHIHGIFQQSILPVWEMSKSNFLTTWHSFITTTLPSLFNLFALFIVFSIFIIMLFFYSKINRFLYFLTIIVFCGFILFMVLWFQAFNVHDYFMINLLIFFILPLVAILDMLKRCYPELFKSLLIKIPFLACLVIFLYSAALNTRVKYSIKDKMVVNYCKISGKQMKYWEWYHWDYYRHYNALENITPYLRSAGIRREDKVVSIPDQSPDITLYLMDQKGYTDFGYTDIPVNNIDRRIKLFIEKGAKYLIVNNDDLYKNNLITPFLKNKIGSYKNVDIYDLKPLVNN